MTEGVLGLITEDTAKWLSIRGPIPRQINGQIHIVL